jgi:hypothetical protein
MEVKDKEKLEISTCEGEKRARSSSSSCASPGDCRPFRGCSLVSEVAGIADLLARFRTGKDNCKCRMPIHTNTPTHTFVFATAVAFA